MEVKLVLHRASKVRSMHDLCSGAGAETGNGKWLQMFHFCSFSSNLLFFFNLLLIISMSC